MLEPIRLVEIKGASAERGYQHGEILKEEINTFYRGWIEASQSCPNPPQEKELLDHAMEYLPFTEEYAPDLVEEMEGVAEGAGLSFEKIFLLNCWDEISSFTPDVVTLKGGCTSFGAAGTATVGGVTYVGQADDMDALYLPIVLKIAREGNEPEIMMLTHPGIIGKAGMNSAGLGMVWNSLKSTDERKGVPASILLRKAMQQMSLSEAIGVVINAHRANGLNLIFGSPYAVANLEATATRFDVKYQNILSHANFYESPRLKDDDALVLFVPDSLIRSGRMMQLLESYYGEIDLETCKEIMRDHANYPGSICRHDIPGRNNTWTTVANIVLIPAQGIMLASNGRPCESPFHQYQLDTLDQIPGN